MKRAKLLADDWSSDCLATAYSVKKLFFCNNGVDDEGYIEESKDKSENENTKDNTER